MLSGEATNTNFIVFGLTRSGLKPTIYRTQGEPANHYTTDAVYQGMFYFYLLNIFITTITKVKPVSFSMSQFTLKRHFRNYPAFKEEHIILNNVLD